MRTTIDVPDQLIQSLDPVSGTEQCSRVKSVPPAEVAFGLWKQRGIDGVRYQKELWDEWGSW